MIHEKFYFGRGVLGRDLPKDPKSSMRNSSFELGVFLVRCFQNSLYHPREVSLSGGGFFVGFCLKSLSPPWEVAVLGGWVFFVNFYLNSFMRS